jgi:hypothetical protein
MFPLEKQKICNLLFFVDQEVENRLIEEVEEFIQGLAASREWLLGPPVFVNEGGEEDDYPYTLGGLFRLYSSYAPAKLPKDVDRIHLEEVKEILRQVQRFSEEKQIVFCFELDQDQIGWIEKGVVDELMQLSLLDEWERVLQGEEDAG